MARGEYIDAVAPVAVIPTPIRGCTRSNGEYLGNITRRALARIHIFIPCSDNKMVAMIVRFLCTVRERATEAGAERNVDDRALVARVTGRFDLLGGLESARRSISVYPFDTCKDVV